VPRRRRLRSAALAMLLATTALVPLATGWTPAFSAAATSAAPQAMASMPASFANLVERVSPAVVSIATTQVMPAGLQGAPRMPPGLQEFFRQFGGPFAPQGMVPEAREMHALGSGFIIDPAGYVVTNNHVIDGASKVTVMLSDDTNLDATIIGRDAKTDLALLKVDAGRKLPSLAFGDSDKVRVGDWAIAVGDPFGLGGTVTAGIVSARGRDLRNGPYDDYLQLDAPINQGNSGGPALDADGEVIGINSAILSPSGGNIGIGFAIPSNLAQPVIAQLKSEGHVSRSWLGVQIQAVTPPIAESLGLNQPEGALVAEVSPDSPAAEAGLHAGDVLLAFDGQAIATARDLSRRVAEASIDSRHKLAVWRDGERQTLSVNLAASPDQEAQAYNSEADHGAAPAASLGLELATLDPGTRAQAGLSDEVQGVLVVDATGEAAASVQPGDVIVSVDRQTVRTPAEVAAKVQQAEQAGRKAVLLLLSRDGHQRFAALELARA
jgi:serine protease Do